jgi:hypothetical protein
MLRNLRIAVLLVILLVVAVKTWQDQRLSKRWRVPLYVSIYPIAADDSAVTRDYLAHLDAERFKPIDTFFAREAQRYQLSLAEPFRTRLRAELHDRPPQRAADAGMLSTALWSLKLRYWAWHESGHAGEPEDIRVFVLYHDPALTPSVPHSLGLTKGLIGVVYAFAAPQMKMMWCSRTRCSTRWEPPTSTILAPMHPCFPTATATRCKCPCCRSTWRKSWPAAASLRPTAGNKSPISTTWCSEMPPPRRFAGCDDKDRDPVRWDDKDHQAHANGSSGHASLVRRLISRDPR